MRLKVLVRCGLELVGNPLPKDRNGRPPSISILVRITCQTINLATSCRNEKLSERLYRTLNHLRDGIWSHHGQQTALLEIELSLLEFAVSITRSVHAIEVSVVRDRISRSVS